MSALHPELQGALAQLLQGLNSTDNEVRGKYEDSLTNEWQAQKPDALLLGLVEHAHSAQDEKVGAVLHGKKRKAYAGSCDLRQQSSSEE